MSTPDTLNSLISIREAARRLGVTPTQIMRRVRAGTLPAARPEGARGYLVRWGDVCDLYVPAKRGRKPQGSGNAAG